MRWTDARLRRGAALTAAGCAAWLALAPSYALAASGEIGRYVGAGKTSLAAAAPCPHAKTHSAKDSAAASTAETVIASLIGAGQMAWNATLGGVMPAPEIKLVRVSRA